MNGLEVIGILTILFVIALLIYIFVISPIINILEVYKYNKKFNRLNATKQEIEYWYDKLYMLTNERMTIERQIKDKKALQHIHDDYKKINDIINEEISKKVGWILDSDGPSELSERYYKAHSDLKALKSKLGIKY
jgi:hypothetical protein